MEIEIQNKKCNICNLNKGIDCFGITGKMDKYRRKACKDCVYAYNRKRYFENPEVKNRTDSGINKRNKTPKYKLNRTNWATFSPKGIYGRIVASSKKRGFGDILSQEDFVVWYLSQEKKCSYCDIEAGSDDNRFFMGKYQLSIDRIDSSKGYVCGNLCLACCRCNQTKSNFFTFSEMREIAQKFIKPKFTKDIC